MCVAEFLFSRRDINKLLRMNFDSVVFPAPPASYKYEEFREELFFVPRARLVHGFSDFTSAFPADDGNNVEHIPCHFFNCSRGSSKVLLYFHGNAEDLGRVQPLMGALSEELNVHTIAVEYPGYGIYPGKPSTDRICDEALNVYDYITTVLRWKPSNIIVFGRSIGSGFATYVGANRSPGMLVLMSAFTSLKSVAKQVACAFSILLADRLMNLELIPQVKCPKVFIHGENDGLVLPANSVQLYEAASEPKRLVLGKGMNHNLFDLGEHLLVPLEEYWSQLGFRVEPELGQAKMDIECAGLPEDYREERESHWSCSI